MKGLRLIRRMESAGLIRYYPEDGKPVVTLENGEFRRVWTARVVRETEHYLISFDSPDDLYSSMVTNKKALLLGMFE